MHKLNAKLAFEIKRVNVILSNSCSKLGRFVKAIFSCRLDILQIDVQQNGLQNNTE